MQVLLLLQMEAKNQSRPRKIGALCLEAGFYSLLDCYAFSFMKIANMPRTIGVFLIQKVNEKRFHVRTN